MDLIFYRAKYGNLFDKAVAFWSHGPFSHVELRFSSGACFSSSPRDGGTRFKVFKIEPERWVTVPLSLTPEEIGLLAYWCGQHVGLRYDWLGIFGLFIGESKLEGERRWYCSEICAAALREVGDWEGSVELSPNAMARVFGVEG